MKTSSRSSSAPMSSSGKRRPRWLFHKSLRSSLVADACKDEGIEESVEPLRSVIHGVSPDCPAIRRGVRLSIFSHAGLTVQGRLRFAIRALPFSIARGVSDRRAQQPGGNWCGKRRLLIRFKSSRPDSAVMPNSACGCECHCWRDLNFARDPEAILYPTEDTFSTLFTTSLAGLRPNAGRAAAVTATNATSGLAMLNQEG